MNPEPIYTLALTYVSKLGPVNQKKILKHLNPETIWSLSEKDLKEIFKERKDIISQFLSLKCLEKAEKEIEFCKRNDIEILLHSSGNYPEKLKNCTDSPLVLFKKGSHDFNKKLHIGIVGTRKMTPYGKRFIENLLEEISTQQMVIVSGLAYGCDIEAHRLSIENQIPNVAVLAHGLNRISPAAHKKEASELQKNGALLTEYSSFHNAEPIILC